MFFVMCNLKMNDNQGKLLILMKVYMISHLMMGGSLKENMVIHQILIYLMLLIMQHEDEVMKKLLMMLKWVLMVLELILKLIMMSIQIILGVLI